MIGKRNFFLTILLAPLALLYNIIVSLRNFLFDTKILHSKESLTILTLPSYGQELNPVERFFGEMRKVTANRTYTNIEELEKLLDDEIAIWMADKERMKRLTYWEWIEEQIY